MKRPCWARSSLSLVLVLGLGATVPGVARGQDALERADRLNAEVVRLSRLGRYGEAIVPARETLALREQALGPTHREVAASLSNLAGLLHQTGDAAGARPLYERALRTFEQALGPTHRDLAPVLSNFAQLLELTGNWPAARRLYERELLIFEHVLGPAHPGLAWRRPRR